MVHKTQLDQVKSDIITLEIKLAHSVLYEDAFSQIALYKELEVKKGLKNMYEWM